MRGGYRGGIAGLGWLQRYLVGVRDGLIRAHLFLSLEVLVMISLEMLRFVQVMISIGPTVHEQILAARHLEDGPSEYVMLCATDREHSRTSTHASKCMVPSTPGQGFPLNNASTSFIYLQSAMSCPKYRYFVIVEQDLSQLERHLW